MTLLLCFLCLPVHAQDAPSEALPDSAVLARHIADRLRTQHGIRAAVELTRSAWLIINSFATPSQAETQWQLAREAAANTPENTAFSGINSSLLAALLLTLSTDGMGLDEWRFTRFELPPDLLRLQDDLNDHELFAIHARLAEYWQLLLEFARKNQQNLHWLGDDLLTGVPSAAATENPASATDRVLRHVVKDAPDAPLAALLATLDRDAVHLDGWQIALLRLQHHRSQNLLLPQFYDWVELHQWIWLAADPFAAAHQKLLDATVQRGEAWLQENREAIAALNAAHPALLSGVFTAIRSKLTNPDYVDSELNRRIAQLLSGVRDLATYMEQPFRQAVHTQLEVCLNLSAEFPPLPAEPIQPNQLQGCLEDLRHWAVDEAASANLSGNLEGLYDSATLSRALQSPSWQIINYLKASSHEAGCYDQQRAFVNPLEWLLASETAIWLFDRWPALMQEHRHLAPYQSMLQAGLRLRDDNSCATQTQFSDQIARLASLWNKVKLDTDDYIRSYSQENLSAGSDINFFEPVTQFTQHVPEGFSIQACDTTSVCGAQVTLEPSSGLLALFPNHLRLAQQLGLGELRLCYDRIGWVERRTGPTHLDNNKIANFHGRLSMQLKGQFRGETVFVKQINSQQEYNYLFGENTAEVLDMYCPLPIIGKQIVTSLDRGTFGLLPNRLTFLTAARASINQIITSNWNDGEEWLKKLDNETHSELLEFNPFDEVVSEVNSAFTVSTNQLQSQIYANLMIDDVSATRAHPLVTSFNDYLTYREFLGESLRVNHPELLYFDARVQAVLFGSKRIPDGRSLQENFHQHTSINELYKQFDQRLAEVQGPWTLNSDLPAYSWINETSAHLQDIIKKQSAGNQAPVEENP